MLIELKCDKFHQKTITFHKGLNVALGTHAGDNSLGKSTFLMILDYIFGGDDYITINDDVQRHVGYHEFFYKFLFGEEIFCFKRDNTNTSDVYVCDENYNIKDKITIDKYRKFLQDKYGLMLPFASFRNMVGRFSRVYGKENIDEHKPLTVVKGESSAKSVEALLILFNLFEVISNYAEVFRLREDQLDVFTKAQEYNYLPVSMTKRQYKSNAKLIEECEQQIKEIENKINVKNADFDTSLSREAIELKQRLSIAKSQRSKLYSKIFKIKENLEYKAIPTYQEFENVLKFFPDCKIAEIVDIEVFHKDITQILSQQLKKEKKVLENELALVEALIKELNEQFISISKSSNISLATLKNYSAIQSKKEKLIAANQAYDEKARLEEAKKVAKENLETVSEGQLTKLEKTINDKMVDLNDFIYGGKKTSPTIKFKNMRYDFFTPDDTGTGSSYKGMIVYDLSILQLTALPYLIHDSLMLKQVADEAVVNILKLYCFTEKQIFIAMDKQSSYGDTCQKILEENKVISLAPGGMELFGISWNLKS